jgi:undecaprenyl-diphosphatase
VPDIRVSGLRDHHFSSAAWGWSFLLSVLGFGLLVWLKSSETGRQLDLAVLLRLQTGGDEASPLGPPWLLEAGRDLTALGSTSILIISTLAVFGWLLIQRRWRGALLALIVIAGGAGLSFLLKLLFSRPRPDLLADPTAVFTSSFPSSHAMASVVTFMTLAWVIGRGLASDTLRRYLLACAVTVSLISGLSRLYLGVHWPSDVVAGWLAGLAWLCLCAGLLSFWNPAWQRPFESADLAVPRS